MKAAVAAGVAKHANVVNTFNTETGEMEAESGKTEATSPKPTSPVQASVQSNGASAISERDKKQWQRYASAKQSIRTLSATGVKISFTAHKYMTNRADVIDWLDGEIAVGGLPGITKIAGLVSIADIDPMEAIRRKHFEEFEAAELEKKKDRAVGIVPDMGNTKPVSEQLNAMSSNGVAG